VANVAQTDVNGAGTKTHINDSLPPALTSTLNEAANTYEPTCSTENRTDKTEGGTRQEHGAESNKGRNENGDGCHEMVRPAGVADCHAGRHTVTYRWDVFRLT
jgi:hypothetical protein